MPPVPHDDSSTSRPTRILSIDGGGIRGLIAAEVLIALERRLAERTGDPRARIGEHFDLVAGTSTGGILACICLCPGEDGRPRFSAQDAKRLYMEHGEAIFSASLWHRLRSVGGYSDERFPAAGLEETLAEYLGDLELKDLLKPCLITAYDIERRKAHFFRQHRATTEPNRNFFVKDVCRATSAAPTYFEAAKVESRAGVAYPLIDGGVFANNPALCAYAEARKRLPGQPHAKDMVLLSVGTGSAPRPYDHDDVADWGRLTWAKPLLDIMMSGVAETVDYQLQQVFDTTPTPESYLRVETDLPTDSDVDALDNVEPDNLDKLSDIGIELASAERIAPRLDALADRLVGAS